ncbi:hypothetical protein LS70_001210 [Helicobacter sp. MIT 11-5569]|uniref:hypothetical protein n=1 Tax=Helicobacter sp. MIT 11-5569 TaxID=1548151 RepID=UPI00051FAEFD|nr:hypothetical protein [Helicobacter sp. MIT 11-5569]TLD85196.1 hypothetical protein LS70_001210 [Helicobacter sp. MIT 11-5569]
MSYKYFFSFAEFKKGRRSNLFWDFEEIKAKRVYQEFKEDKSVHFNHSMITYHKNARGDSSYL